jgi:oligoribonuclease
MNTRKIAWIDVETTDLDVTDPRVLLLEVGIYVTELDLQHVGQDQATIHWSQEELMDARWSQAAVDMHTENGLLEDVRREDGSSLTLERAQQRLLSFLYRCGAVDYASGPDKPGSSSEDENAPIWGGCSTWIDRTILKRDMPELYERIHYRTIDATSLKLGLELWAGHETHRSHHPHRALEDAKAACKLANQLRRRIMPVGCPVS